MNRRKDVIMIISEWALHYILFIFTYQSACIVELYIHLAKRAISSRPFPISLKMVSLQYTLYYTLVGKIFRKVIL